MPDEFNSFLKRLQIRKGALLSKKLQQFISVADFISIIEYFLENEKAHAIIKSLLLGKSHHFAKEQTALPRTVNIRRLVTGEFELILETKSKLANNKKAPPPGLAQGSTKIGKPSYRVDCLPEKDYFGSSMACSLEKAKEEITALLADAVCSQVLYHESIVTTTEGPTFEKKGKYKALLYSDLALGSLRTFFPYFAQVNLKNIFIIDLLRGIRVIHDQGWVHQDLSSNNLVIYEEKDNYRLKITDFGLTTTHGFGSASATIGYHSPEIAYFYSAPESRLYEYFNVKHATSFIPSLAYHYKDRYCLHARREFATAHYANDMWAAGIIIFEMMYQRLPSSSLEDENLIQSNPLLKGLLDKDRATRFTAEEALELHYKMVLEGFQQHPSASCVSNYSR